MARDLDARGEVDHRFGAKPGLTVKRIAVVDPDQSNIVKSLYSAGMATLEEAMLQDRYQTVQEVADRLEVAEATARQWIRSGALRAIDIGKGWRIATTELCQLLLRQQTAPREAAVGQLEMPDHASELPVVGSGKGNR